MSYKTEALECLKKSLTHVICSKSILRLEDFITRIDLGDKVTHRITLKDGTPVTSVADLIGHLSLDEMDYSYSGLAHNYTNQAMGITLIPTNLILSVTEFREADSEVRSECGGPGRFLLGFTLTYLNDNDQDLPLKLIYFTPRGIRNGTESQ